MDYLRFFFLQSSTTPQKQFCESLAANIYTKTKPFVMEQPLADMQEIVRSYPLTAGMEEMNEDVLIKVISQTPICHQPAICASSLGLLKYYSLH